MSIYQYINSGREASRRRNTASYSIFVPIGYPPTSGGTPPTITSSAPPSGTQSSAYTHTFTATGTAPITWSVSSGSLPAGLSLNASTGVLSGTPSGSGTTGFTVRATNGSGTADQVVSLVVAAAYGAPVVTGVTWSRWWEAGLIGGLANNDPVGTWTDAIISQNATASGAARPLYKTSGIGGKPALSFDGTDDKMLMGGVIPSASAASLICVITPNDARSAVSLWSSSTFNLRGQIGFNVVGGAGSVDINAASPWRSLGIPSAGAVVAVITVGASGAIHYRNGTSFATAVGPTTVRWDESTFGVGQTDGGIVRTPNITLAVLGFVARELTAGEVASISTPLMSRYGIT